MASRRLDISSLLCDDQIPEPVILAPHLRQPRQSSPPSHNRPPSSPTTSPTFPSPSQMLHSHRPLSSHSHPPHHHHSPSYSLPSPALPSSSMAPKLPSFGLEALVQAATEERRRLSVSGPPEDAQRRLSPNVETRHVQPQHFPQQPPFRQHKPSSPVLHHSPTTSPSQSMRSPVQLIRSPAYSPATHHRHRDDQQVRHNAAEDAHYRPLQSPYFSPPLQSQPTRVHDHRTQQQQELDRQRLHHEQLLLQEQQQQKYARERQAVNTDRQILPPPTHSRTPSMPLHVDPPSRHPQPQQSLSLSHSPVPGQLHTSGRKSDPGQPHIFNLDRSAHFLQHPAPQDDIPSHPNKKRRYSDSPGHLTTAEGIQRGRDKMATGGLGYGRPEPVDLPGRPRSGYGHGRKHLDLVELMSPNYEAPRVQPSAGAPSMQVAHSEGFSQSKESKDHSSEAGTTRNISLDARSHEVIVRETFRQDIVPSEGNLHEGGSREGGSRVRRRSPPGSQSGRAIAAKKSEEVEQSLHDLLRSEPVTLHGKETQPPPSPMKTDKPIVEKERKPEIVEKVLVTPELESRMAPSGKDSKSPASEKEHKKRPSSRLTIDNAVVAAPMPTKKPRTVSVQSASAPKPAEEDAHEWFLEHFDDYNGPAQPQLPPPKASSPPSPSVRQPPVLKARTPTPVNMPDAADALEQELEELLVDSPPVGKVDPSPDMDVDLVTELVAETLEADDTKANVGMEVDVEDELLSLLDDRPSSRRPVTKAATPGPSAAKTIPSVAMNGTRHASPSATPLALTPSPAALVPPVPRPSSTRPVSERGSMPPPTSVSPARGKEKEERDSSIAVAPMKKKKDTLSKVSAKPKAIATLSGETPAIKSRAKPGPKAKAKPSDSCVSIAPVKMKAATGPKKSAPSRSRSTSAMPSGSAGPEGASESKAEKQEEEEDSNQEDNKLYCVCKTTYDEDRFMIACDRCDEWYHTQCVDMPDLEVDLVDQFICPLCIEKHPNLHLKTTYKTRCLYGLRHPDPSSTKACHRPARGVFSKYCSDECGVKYMQSRADAWAKKGGKKDKLWETVKDAEKREGVVVCVAEPNGTKMEVDGNDGDLVLKQKKTKVDREVERLHRLLDSIVRLREDVKKEMEGVIWREKLLELATVRAEQIGECGWDQRLCFGDDECADLGAGVLESYDVNLQNGETAPSGKWWCSGKKVCDRHAGWQAVRVKDVSKEKEKKNDALLNLTTREREIRKRIEDILDPHGLKCDDSSNKSPLKTSNAKLSNGHTKGKGAGDTTTKKGKKRKAPS